MDEIEQRLKEATAACLNSYQAWRKNEKDTDKREELQENVHELRKITARLEIEIAISERNEAGQKRIPIPAHRSGNRKSQTAEADENGIDDDDFGNAPAPRSGGSSSPSVGGPKVSRVGRRRPATKGEE